MPSARYKFLRAHPIFAASHTDECALQKDTTMNTRSAFNRIGNAMRAFGSAVAASRAIESGLTPEARHLRRLGIDPKQFGEIGRF
jgi:hypothetical protein